MVSNLFVIQPVSYPGTVPRHPAHEDVPVAVDLGEVADAPVPVAQVVVVHLDLVLVVAAAPRLPAQVVEGAVPR